MLLPWFNFAEDAFLRIGQKVAKICSFENFFEEISYNIYNIYNRYIRNDVRSMFREREKKVHQKQRFLRLSDQYFLPYILCKHPTMFQKRMDISPKKSD